MASLKTQQTLRNSNRRFPFPHSQYSVEPMNHKPLMAVLFANHTQSIRLKDSPVHYWFLNYHLSTTSRQSAIAKPKCSSRFLFLLLKHNRLLNTFRFWFGRLDNRNRLIYLLYWFSNLNHNRRKKGNFFHVALIS